MLEPTSGNVVDLSWVEAHRLAVDLAKQVEAFHFNVIIAITKGGLVPAAILTQLLSTSENPIPIDTVGISSYTHHKQSRRGSMLYKTSGLDRSQRALIIDDISDTGSTMRIAKGLFDVCVGAVLVTKPKGLKDIEYYASNIPQDTWVKFPWETE